MVFSRFLTLILLSLFLFASCGPSKLILTPNYNNKELAKYNYNEKIKVLNATDNRNKKDDEFGIAQVGLFNKEVPYLMKGKVSEFVKESINRIIFSKNNDTTILPIEIIVDQFEVYEKTTAFSETGNFDCVLKFVYPINDDSLTVIRTETHQEYKGMDVTNSLKELVYKGIANCAITFMTEYKKHESSYLTGTLNSSFPSQYNIQKYVKDKKTKKTIKKKNSTSTYLGITYSTGINVDYGVQLLYQQIDSLKTKLYGGFGYTLQYIKLLDTYKFNDAYFLNYNLRYTLRYFLLENNKGPYLGASLKLLFGTEKIALFDGNRTNFFFGPTFGEVIGYSINNKIMFELGSYQIKLFGSDLLSSDLGYSLGMMIAL